MKRALCIVGTFVVPLLFLACSGGGEAPARPGLAAPDMLARLEQLTGARWASDNHPVTGKPHLYLSLDDGRPVLPSVNDGKEVLAFLSPLHEELGIRGSLERQFDEADLATVAAAESLGTLRFPQHVPGTRVPVFGGELIVGFLVDGSLAYIQSWAAQDLSSFDATPAITPELARAAALAAVPGGAIAEGTGPTLGVEATDPERPILVFRVAMTEPSGSRRVDVDARSGVVVASVVDSSSAIAQVYSGRSMYPITDPRAAPGATLSVEVNGGHLGGPGALGPILPLTLVKVGQQSNHVPIPVTQMPMGFLAADTVASSSVHRSPAMAVDALYNVSRVSSYFAGQLGMRTWAAAATPIVVHHDGWEGNAAFWPSTKSIYVGDGVLNASGTGYSIYPVSSSLDFMAHEVGHGVIEAVTSGRTRGFSQVPLFGVGEPGALNEGVSDVLAASAKAFLTSSTNGVFRFGPDVRGDGVPLRDYLHPSRGASGGATHWSTRLDFAQTHYNSTLVSQPWTLMVQGGYNEVSHLGVTTELGFARAVALYWETLHSVSANESIRGFADKMIAYQIKNAQLSHPTRVDLSPYWVKHSILCAWTAVGVISSEDARLRHGVTCPYAFGDDAPTCKGKIDGAYCDARPRYDYSAYICRGQSILSGYQCPTNKYCHRSTGSFSSLAQTGPDGRVICHDQPQTD